MNEYNKNKINNDKAMFLNFKNPKARLINQENPKMNKIRLLIVLMLKVFLK